jgi:acetylornithine aminotransferase
MEKSFHGRTMATDHRERKSQGAGRFRTLANGICTGSMQRPEAVAQVGVHNKNVVAILVEPYQEKGRQCAWEASYLQGLRHLCDQNGWLLMLTKCSVG